MYGIDGYIEPLEVEYEVLASAGESKSSRRGRKPKLRRLQHHSEIKPAEDASVLAISTGVVLDISDVSRGDILLQLPGGEIVEYYDLADVVVKPGDSVEAGQPIGRVSQGDILKLYVSRDGESVASDGEMFAPAPKTFRDKLSEMSDDPFYEEGIGMKNNELGASGEAENIEVSESPDQAIGETITVLKGTRGVVVPDSEMENELYEAVADMQLDAAKESAYAEVAKAVASARDSIESRPMLQSSNPIRAEIVKIFDLIEV